MDVLLCTVFVCGCAVSRRYVVNMYLDHLKLYVLMVEGMSVVVYVMSLMSVTSPSPALCNLSVHTLVKLCTLCVFALGVSSRNQATSVQIVELHHKT